MACQQSQICRTSHFPKMTVFTAYSGVASCHCCSQIIPRNALVLELTVGQRLVYWIETETIGEREHYCSLAVEMANGGLLDEGVLEALLDGCSIAKGVWLDPLPYGAGTILSTRARNTVINGQLT